LNTVVAVVIVVVVEMVILALKVSSDAKTYPDENCCFFRNDQIFFRWHPVVTTLHSQFLHVSKF